MKREVVYVISLNLIIVNVKVPSVALALALNVRKKSLTEVIRMIKVLEP